MIQYQMLIDVSGSSDKKNQIQPTFTDINWTRMSSQNGNSLLVLIYKSLNSHPDSIANIFFYSINIFDLKYPDDINFNKNVYLPKGNNS